VRPTKTAKEPAAHRPVARHCSNRSNEVLAAEAAKCDLLCANCHAEVEEELYLARARLEDQAQEPLVPSEAAC
jgi:hypothetical protein